MKDEEDPMNKNIYHVEEKVTKFRTETKTFEEIITYAQYLDE